ncbi:MAG: DUF4249 family protein [Bacteroidota bacterium]
MAALALTGCEEGVDPFVDTDRFYTIYGFLDPAADTQFIRVEEIRQLIDPGEPGPIDATVSVTENETGTVYAMQDSLVFFDDGTVGHIFFAPFTPLHGYSYTLDVQRSDGIQATATTTLPEFIRAEINNPATRTLSSGGQIITQTVEWDGVDFTPFRVQVWYRFAGSQPTDAFRDFSIAYTGDQLGNFNEDTWVVRIGLTEDQTFLKEEVIGIPAAQDFPFELYGVGMQVTVPDDQWRPPGGVFDEEILSQPGTLSNVTGGFGFFGSVAQYRAEWTLSEETARQLGYPYPASAGE